MQISYPNSWIIKNQNKKLCLHTKQKNIFIYIFKTQKKPNLEKLSQILWRQIKSNLNLQLISHAQIQNYYDFESISQLAYQTPIGQEQSLISIALQTRNNTYWLLLEAHTPALKQYGHELEYIIKNFKFFQQ